MSEHVVSERPDQPGPHRRSALVVVDVQRDFCEGGSLGVAGGTRVARSVAERLATEHGYDHVVATRDHHIDPGAHFSATPDYVDSWPPHCVVGTTGVELHDALEPAAFESVFDKGEYAAAYSGFEGRDDRGQDLAGWLAERGVSQVHVCGIATDHCVRATALDAAASGFDTTVLLDLTAAVTPERLPETLRALAEVGVQTSGELSRS